MDAASLHFIGRKLVMLAERAIAAPEGMPAQPTAELLVLRAVLERPGVTVTELAAQLAIAQSRISQVVATLERDGWVERYADESDRRRQRIKPTQHFQQDVDRRLAREVNDALAPLFIGVTEREKTRLLVALAQLHDLLRRADEQDETRSQGEPAAAPPPPRLDRALPGRSSKAPAAAPADRSKAAPADRSKQAAPRPKGRRSTAKPR